MILPRPGKPEELFSEYKIQRIESDKFGMMIWPGPIMREVFLSE
jgi:hypothetical protein